MANAVRQPCDEEIIRSEAAVQPCPPSAGSWVLAATVLGSSIASKAETALAVALTAVKGPLGLPA